MKEKRNLWELDELGRRYGQRPSSFLGLKADSWEAYQLDVATLTLGRWVDGKLGERNRQGQRIHRLSDLLDDKPKQSASTGGFRSASHLVRKKVAIGPDGTW